MQVFSGGVCKTPAEMCKAIIGAHLHDIKKLVSLI